jgi:hypothetical protein
VYSPFTLICNRNSLTDQELERLRGQLTVITPFCISFLSGRPMTVRPIRVLLGAACQGHGQSVYQRAAPFSQSRNPECGRCSGSPGRRAAPRRASRAGPAAGRGRRRLFSALSRSARECVRPRSSLSGRRPGASRLSPVAVPAAPPSASGPGARRRAGPTPRASLAGHVPP